MFKMSFVRVFQRSLPSLCGGRVLPALGNKRLCSSGDRPPFHHAFPVNDLHKAREFYGSVLGCKEGRSTDRWIDFELFGHQIVAHYSKTHPYVDHFNPVDGDDVPVPHFGACLEWKQFEEFAERLKSKGVKFIIEPHVRFPGRVGEQYTMFFKDPAGNNLEFKALKDQSQLFEKFSDQQS